MRDTVSGTLRGSRSLGGVGLDEDHPVHRYFLAAKHHEFLLGNATDQLRALGKVLAAVPA